MGRSAYARPIYSAAGIPYVEPTTINAASKETVNLAATSRKDKAAGHATHLASLRGKGDLLAIAIPGWVGQ